jgi:hypothetical protein
VRASGSFCGYRTLETGRRRQRKMADPEHEVRSFVQRISSAYPFHDSFFKMDTKSAFYLEINIHVLPQQQLPYQLLILFYNIPSLFLN